MVNKKVMESKFILNIRNLVNELADAAVEKRAVKKRAVEKAERKASLKAAKADMEAIVRQCEMELAEMSSDDEPV